MKINNRTAWAFAFFTMLTGIFSSCSFLSSLKGTSDNSISISSLSLGRDSLETEVGAMEYVSVSVKPSDRQKEIKLSWNYNSSIIECDTSSSWGVTIKGIAEGQTTLRCSYGGYDAACLVTVKGVAEGYETVTEPYIYSNYTILQTAPGVSEKVFVSLYGGDASDVDGYSWTIDNTSVASIQSTGQYCLVTAKEAGYARIKVTHMKATYPYYIGIYVFEDTTKIKYITTQNNIVSMNIDDEEQVVSVSLMNGSGTEYDGDFSWEMILDDGSAAPVELDIVGRKAVVKPIREGSCTIRVTHPEAAYPLDILCRVITVVKNVYIKSDRTVVTLSGDSQESLTFNLENIKEGEYDPDGFNFSLDDYSVARIVASAGNQVTLQGISNGSCKLTASHEKSAYPREVLVISNGQTKNSVDASLYITTSDNYIRTKEGAEGQKINIALKGGEDGDEDGFIWSIESSASDGSTDDVINLDTAYGSVVRTGARMASQSYVNASAFMEPLKEGTAIIKITHPKTFYPTEILVKVLSKDAILEEPLYFSGPGIIKIQNGKEYEYTVSLLGENKKESDDALIRWECNSQHLKVDANEDMALISAPANGTGSTAGTVTISHPKADYSKKVVVLTADDEESLDAMKALYSDKTYYSIKEGSTATVYLYASGYSEDDDFSHLTWNAKNPETIEIERNASNPFSCSVKGIRCGSTKLIASLDGNECTYDVTVYPEGSTVTENEVYLTTGQNVISLKESGRTASATVTAVNLKSSEYMNIQWNSSNPEVASVAGNGTTATVMANSEGESVISVSHKDSQNVLKIYVRVGSEYVMEDTKSVVYIKADDLTTLLKGEEKKISAGLVNFTDPDCSGFSFKSLDTSVAVVSGQSDNGTALIRGVSSGITEIRISHKATKVTKNMLIVVGDSTEKINETIKGSETVKGKVYLVSKNNTVTFSSVGKTRTISLTACNMNSEDWQSIIWKSTDPSIAEVYGNGTSATITSKSRGYTTVTASFDGSMNSLTYHVFVDTEDISESVVSIKAEDLITAIIGGDETMLTASLVNFSGNDKSGFSFESSNPDVAIVSSQSANGTALIRGLESGTAEIIIRHSATSVTKSVLVIVGKTEDEIKEIINGRSEKGMVYFLSSGNTVNLEETGSSATVFFTAVNLEKSEYSKIVWNTGDPSVAEVYGNGTSATIKACGHGNAVVEASYEGSLNSALFHVFVGDEYMTESVISIKTDDLVTLVTGGEEKKISACLEHCAENNTTGFSFFVEDEGIAMITASSENGTAYLKGLKPGHTEVVVSHHLTPVSRRILVIVGESEKEIDDIIESSDTSKKVYLTIPSNTLAFSKTDVSRIVSVQAVNLDSSRHSEITWKSSDESVAEVYPNGNSATVKANGKGTAVIEVSHPDSINSLFIYVSVGTEDIVRTVVTIEAEDFITAIEGGTETRLSAELRNYSGEDESGFTFRSSDPETAEITGQSANGTALIKGIKSGTCEILISHSATKVVKSVLVVVGKTEKEIKEITGGIQTKGSVYFLTSSSTVTFQDLNEIKNIGVDAVNLDKSEYSSISWTSLNPDIAEVYPSGNTATVRALKEGKAVIEVSYFGSLNKATFYVFIGSEYVKETETTISSDDLVTLIVGGEDKRLSALLVNCGDTGRSGFVFESLNPDVVEITAQSGNGTAYIHALKNGYGEIEISNASAATVKRVLVVAGNNEEDISEVIEGTTVKGKVYLTSKLNALFFSSEGKYEDVTVEAVNLESSDIPEIIWTSSSPSVAEVFGNGKKATIYAKGSGTAVVEASHPDSINSIKFYVFVNTDDEIDLVPSIEAENLVTLIAGGDDIRITASLMNSGLTDSSVFSFMSADENIAKISAQSGNGIAYIKGISSGYTEITVANSGCTSVKKILAVVGKNAAEIDGIIGNATEDSTTDASEDTGSSAEGAGNSENKKNIYFTAAENTLAFSNTGTTRTISVQAVNLPSSQRSEISWKSSDASIAEVYGNGTTATVKACGKGSAVIEVSHPESMNTMNIYVFIETDDVVAASVSIESENLITLISGGNKARLNASLKNYSGSDSSGFNFISTDTSIAEITGQSGNGTAIIEGKHSGICEIIISNEHTISTRSVLVVVGDSENEINRIVSGTELSGNVYLSIEDNTVSFDSSGKSKKISIEAGNLAESDYSEISWKSSDGSVAEVIGNGTSATIKAKGDGTAVIEASHPESINRLRIYVFVNTDDVVQVVPSIKCEDIVTVIADGDDVKISASIQNSESSDGTGFFFNSENEKIAEIAAQSTNGTAYIKGISAGYTEITVSHSDLSATKKILVVVGKNESEIDEIIGTTITRNKVYLTVSENTLAFSTEGKTKTINIKAVNLDESKTSEIKWTSSDTKIARVYANGKSASIEAVGKGTATIEVTHADSMNTLTIYVFVGTEDVVQTSPSISSEDFMTLITGEDAKRISACLVNYDGANAEGFSFASTDVNVVSITAQSGNGTAYIKGLRTGSAEIIISHEDLQTTKHVLVIVGNSENDIEEKIEGTSVAGKTYLTAKENTVSFGSTGKTKTLSLDAVNLEASKLSAISWSSSDMEVCEVYGNGDTATVRSCGRGKAVIEASHSESINKLRFYVFVDTEDITESVVGIESDSMVTIITGGDDVKLTACLSNCSGNGISGFSFESMDVKIVQIAGQSVNGTAYLKGISSGYTEIRISHTATKVTRQVLAVVGKTQEEVDDIVRSTSAKGSVYLKTDDNIVPISTAGKSKKISLEAVNLDASKYPDITWKSSDEKICTVLGNGTQATVCSKTAGNATIEASIEGSLNRLTYYVFVETEDIVPATGNIRYIASEDVVTLLKGGESRLLQAYLINGNKTEEEGFSFEIDNRSIAEISAQSLNGAAYIKPNAAGQAKITIRHSATSITKQVLVIVGNSSEELSLSTYLTTSSNVVSVGEGNTKAVTVTVKNSDVPVLDGFVWTSSNPSVIGVTAAGSTAMLTGNGIGTAVVTVSCSSCAYDLKIIAQCVDPVAASGNPYIQLSSSVVTVDVGSSYTSVTADLVGGQDGDSADFIWTSSDSSVCTVYGQNEVGKIKALKNGQAYITVRHPKAAYAAQLLVVCDEVTETECYISVPSSIISMKPTSSSQTVTASLVNGNSTDRYNFSWSLDVYDIIDFQYSANVCTITPKQAGTVTITVSHPKAAYSQQIIVNVQEYTDFAFPQSSTTVTQGTAAFLNMEVPVTALSTYVEYSVDNPSICSATGTKAVVQITGINGGTTTVRAKLKSSSTGAVQAEAEILVYVKKAETSEVYITSSSTITTLQKGKSQTLSATLTGNGVTSSDQNSLRWTTSDTDIIRITGISSSGTVTGQQIYITALKAGEALITCSHEKASSDLQFYVAVPGTGTKTVSLNKTYLSITKGSSGSTLKATVDNAEGSSDYSNLEWSAERSNGAEIVRIMGNGQTVTIYPIEVGETTVTVLHPESNESAKCTVVVEADKSISFETNSRKVQPFHSKTIKYTVSPPSALRTWNANQDDDYFTFRDLGTDSDGNGSVEITGVKEGSGNLICVTDGSAKASISVKVSWDYEFSIDTSSLSGTPDRSYTVNYTVNPGDAVVTASESSISDINVRSVSSSTGAGSGVITFTPKSEGTDSITVTARNKDTGETIGTKKVNLNFGYASITITPKVIVKSGSFSHLDSSAGVLYIGDGETVTLGFDVDEDVSWSVSSSSLDKKVSTSNNTKLANSMANQIVIQNTEDTKTQEYLIPVWYVPMEVEEITTTVTINGQSASSTSYRSTDNQLDPKTDFSWKEDGVGFLDTDADWYLSPSHYWRQEIPEKANSRMSIAEYQATPWYWRPAHSAIHNWNGSVAAGPWTAAQTGNQPAELVDVVDTTVVSSEATDILTVTFAHNGLTQKVQIQVITETRNCSYNQ